MKCLKNPTKISKFCQTANWRLHIIPGVFLIAFNTPVLGRTLMIEYARLKTYRCGDENMPKVDNKRMRVEWMHCSRTSNNNFGQVFVWKKTRHHNVPLNMFKVTNKSPDEVCMKIAKRYQQKHQNDVKMFWWFYC